MFYSDSSRQSTDLFRNVQELEIQSDNLNSEVSSDETNLSDSSSIDLSDGDSGDDLLNLTLEQMMRDDFGMMCANGVALLSPPIKVLFSLAVRSQVSNSARFRCCTTGKFSSRSRACFCCRQYQIFLRACECLILRSFVVSSSQIFLIARARI